MKCKLIHVASSSIYDDLVFANVTIYGTSLAEPKPKIDISFHMMPDLIEYSKTTKTKKIVT